MGACERRFPNLLVERQRPEEVNEVALSDPTTCALLHAAAREGDMPHCFLSGPLGTGKTTLARALAGAIISRNCVLERNASDDRGIDAVRTSIADFEGPASYSQRDQQPSTFMQILVVILDEADKMTADAQAALRRLMDRCAPNVRFFLKCNSLSRVAQFFRSRAVQLILPPLPAAVVERHIITLAQGLPVHVPKWCIHRTAEASGGDMRAALNMLHLLGSGASPCVDAAGGRELDACRAVAELRRSGNTSDAQSTIARSRALLLSPGIDPAAAVSRLRQALSRDLPVEYELQLAKIEWNLIHAEHALELHVNAA